jgi:ADP-ribosylation factor GTPase-activating protein 1
VENIGKSTIYKISSFFKMEHLENSDTSFQSLFSSGLGTHISFVRSMTMDSWSDAQIQKMRKGGNQQCNDFLTKHGIDVVNSTTREKYDTPAAFLYQDVLKARLAGTPEPTNLPKIDRKPVEKRAMQGFGSSPPPPPQEDHKMRNILIGTAASVGTVVVMAMLKK